MAIKAIPSGENIAAIDACPTDRIAVPSALNAAPAVCSTPAKLKLRTIVKTARVALAVLLIITLAPLPAAVPAVRMIDTHLVLRPASADVADDTPP